MSSDKHFFSRLLRKNLWLYFFSFIIAPTGYVVKIVMTGTISPEDYGVFAAVISFVMILGSYNDFGMADSLNFFLPEHFKNKNISKITQTFSIALVTQIISSTVIAVILFLMARLLSVYYFSSPVAYDLLLVFTWFFFGDNIFRSINTFFQATQDVILQKFTDFLRNLSQAVIIIGVALTGHHGVIEYAWAYNFSVLFGVIISLVFLSTKYHSYFHRSSWHFTLPEYGTVFKYALFVMLSANISVLLSQLDTQMITLMLGTTQAGYYNLYLSLIRIPFMFLLPGVYFLFPVLSDLIKRGEMATIRRLQGFVYQLFATLALIMTSFFMLFGDVLTTTLFGPSYAVAARILLFSSPFLLFNFLLQIDFQILNASGQPRTKMLILLSAVGVNLVTNYIFIRIFGVEGSAFASGIGWVYIWYLSSRAISQYMGVFQWGLFFRNMLGFTLLSGILSLLHLEDFLTGRWHLFFGLCCVIFIYFIAFCLLNFGQIKKLKELFCQRTLG